MWGAMAWPAAAPSQCECMDTKEAGKVAGSEGCILTADIKGAVDKTTDEADSDALLQKKLLDHVVYRYCVHLHDQ